MAVFPFPQLAELREKYTYNITPFPTSVRSNGRFVTSTSEQRRCWFLVFICCSLTLTSCPSSSGGGGWESDDDADMDDDDSVVTALGCLGPLGGLLAPELQRYQRHLTGWMDYFQINNAPPRKKKKKSPDWRPGFDSSQICFLQTNPRLPAAPAADERGKNANSLARRDLAEKQVLVEMCEIRAALTCFQHKEKCSCVFVFQHRNGCFSQISCIFTL